MIDDAYATATDKGWHEKPDKTFGEYIALIHSEVSEALEAYRDKPLAVTQIEVSEGGKPEGVASELADVLIRIFDMSADLGIPLVRALDMKAEYNTTRSHRHGGKHL